MGKTPTAESVYRDYSILDLDEEKRFWELLAPHFEASPLARIISAIICDPMLHSVDNSIHGSRQIYYSKTISILGRLIKKYLKMEARLKQLTPSPTLESLIIDSNIQAMKRQKMGTKEMSRSFKERFNLRLTPTAIRKRIERMRKAGADV